jgi:DNA-binding CsgD family transcriptional regulator
MPPLSEREQQVLDRLVEGLRTKEIARSLGLSPRTVEIHRSHILRKFGARNAVDLVRKMLSHEEALR